jgi:hypothetical protein
MRWKAKNYNEWHPHFVWFPKKINGEWIWLERIIRRGRPNMAIDKGSKRRWEYVDSEFDLIKMTEAMEQQKKMEVAAGQVTTNAKAYASNQNYKPQMHPEQ